MAEAAESELTDREEEKAIRRVRIVCEVKKSFTGSQVRLQGVGCVVGLCRGELVRVVAPIIFSKAKPKMQTPRLTC